MRRLAAFLLSLLCLPLAAQAAPWTKARTDKDGTLYVDKASIRKVEAGRKAWTLESFRKPQSAPDGKQYLSVRAQQLYDCEARTVTLQSQLFYPEPMAKGEIVGTYKFEAFDAEAVEPGSRYDGAMKLICGRAR
jgi:hypothetical protein